MTATSGRDTVPSDPQLERLRAAFLAGPIAAAPGGCPEPDLVWRAVRGELEPGPMREVLAHVATCRACADDWRIAAELARDAEARGEAPPIPPIVAPMSPWRRWPALAAAAAIALVAAGVLLRMLDPSGFRGEEGPALRSLVPAGAALPRDEQGGVRLRWELAPPERDAAGAGEIRYSVRVTTADLRLIAEGADLAAPEFTVPREALASLPPGARLYWRVEAALPDGERLRSPTFTARLE